jgi:hypothetical protein
MDGKLDSMCMGCEMDRLVNDFFQPYKQAYTPHHFCETLFPFSCLFNPTQVSCRDVLGHLCIYRACTEGVRGDFNYEVTA